MLAKPKYLYKILHLRSWQESQFKEDLELTSEDDDFIHFSTEDQYDRIIAKYWANEPQVVIAKIETEKLMGDLVYEVNPGGSTKYYHLYNGRIPMRSVVETKITHKK